jgi:hypothetical protein
MNTKENLKHPGYTPGSSTCAYNFPDYNYYGAYPYRCIQDPISFHIACSDRNFVGPDYTNSYYIGENTLDPKELQSFVFLPFKK